MTRLALLLVSVLLLPTGCKRPGGGGTNDSFDRRAMLSNLGSNVIVPAIQTFVAEADALADATTAARVAVGSTAQSAALDAARVSFGETMDAWQTLEVFQLGPAAAPDMATGAQGLRDEIYSWPTVNTCRIDQEIVSGDYENADFFDTELVNVYGLDALEYLLHYTSAANTCAPQVDINSNGSWDALGASEVTLRRAEYAEAVAARVALDGAALLSAWQGGFLQHLSTAGTSGSDFGSAQEAVNELFAALFYVELDVKDMKLAVPAGLSVDCPTETCPNALESRWSGRSKENIVANLSGFRAAFLGGATASAGIGFDDFLTELGAPDLATEMAAETDAAIGAVQAVPGTMEEALASNPASVVAAHDAVKAMTDDLKSTFVTVLNLRVPDEGAGDND